MQPPYAKLWPPKSWGHVCKPTYRQTVSYGLEVPVASKTVKYYLTFLFVLIILVAYSISLGSCNNFSFSICWMIRNNTLFDRSDNNLWLNTTNVKSIWKKDRFSSLAVSPTVEHIVTLQYEGDVGKWTFSIMQSTIMVRGKHKPKQKPSKITLEALRVLSANEVFPCETSTLYLYQDENLTLVLGYTSLFLLKLESRNTSMLLVSWMEEFPAAPDPTSSAPVHSVSLYHPKMEAYALTSSDTTSSNHYRFTALESCSPYVACVEVTGTHSLTCLSTVTDPEMPRNLQVISLNNTSVTLTWDFPQNCKFSFFLVTVFYLNGSSHVLQSKSFKHLLDSFVFTVSGLQPCSRVKFGLQTVCEFGTESRLGRMVLVDGNTVHSDMEQLRQTASGPDNYTLSWEVRSTSSISMFRVYHKGTLHASTLLTTHTVAYLEPCQLYPARVEAVCGDSVVMSTKTVNARTGPRGVSDLKYRSIDSTALWTAGSAPNVTFHYQLSDGNSSTLQQGRLSAPVLPLPGLTPGAHYLLEVWEECDGERSAEPAPVGFDGVGAPPDAWVGRKGRHGLQVDSLSPVLVLVVPWVLAESLEDPVSKPNAHLLRIIKNKLEELFTGYPRKSRVELNSFKEMESKTSITFQTFDALVTDVDLPLPVEPLLDHIQSLQSPSITVKDRIIYWDDPDECSLSELNRCPSNSLCINTLDSYTCVCHNGYYDVSSALTPPVDPPSGPICHENGTFTQCLDRLMRGGIAKAFLIGHFGGNVTIVLNDGRCYVDESEALYHFSTSHRVSQCGTKRLVNRTHIAFQNTLTVTLAKEKTITRKDLRVIWKCVYPRNYIRNAQIHVDLEWVNSHSVSFNSSHTLGLTMRMYSDVSYTHSYRDAISLTMDDVLFFEVALQTDMALELLLEVVSCWATEGLALNDTVKAFLLRDGCPVDRLFHWQSVNGLAQRSRFSVHMFTMPQGLPIYFHCLARICRQDEDCTTNCTNPQPLKRSAGQRDVNPMNEAVVSAGPLMINLEAEPDTEPSSWKEGVTMMCIAGGILGFFMFTVLGVASAKVIVTYYERTRLQ